LTLATPVNAVSTCGGTLSAVNGAKAMSLSGVALTAGASCAITVTVTGIHAGAWINTTGPISSSQSGAGAASNAALITVLPIPVNTFLTVTPGSQRAGQSVTLNAMLVATGQPSGETPAAGVTFSISGVSLGSAVLSPDHNRSTGELTVPAPAIAGDYPVTAQFTGVNPDFAVSNATATLRVR